MATFFAHPTRLAPTGRPYARYLGGLGADLAADQIWFVALSWAAVAAGGPGSAGLVTALATAPRMLVLLPAGSLVDRYGALRCAQAAQVGRIVVLLGAIAVAVAQPSSLVLLAVIAVAFGIADGIRMPAASVLPVVLLDAEDLPRGQGLVTIVNRFALVASGPMAGVAIAIGGLPLAASVCCLLCLTAFVAFIRLRPPPAGPQRDPGTLGTWDGLLYVKANPGILVVLTVVTATNVCIVGPLDLGVVLKVEGMGWGAAAIGVLMTCFGLAAALGAASLSLFRPRRRAIEAGFLWSAAAGLGLATLGATPNLWTSCLAAAVSGFSLGPAGALILGTVQARVHPTYVGRVTSLMSFSAFGLTPVGLFGFGLLVDSAGLSASFQLAGGLVALLSIIGLILPWGRKLSAPPSSSPHESA